MIANLKEHSDRITKIKLVNNENSIISSSKDRALLKWDIKS